MFCLCGFVIQKPTREYCIFGKRKKVKNKRGFYATYNFCDVLESYLYMLREI